MRRLLFAGLAILGASLGAGLYFLRPDLPAAERGRRLAERVGCFACHGPEGSSGAANPGRSDRTVPTYTGDLMMFAKSREDIRAWIEKGVTPARAESRTWREQRDRGVLRMPSFEKRLSSRQIDDLVAFVEASGEEPEPDDSSAAHGLERAEALGCVGCHGPGGRLARPNEGSLKGYIPSWQGRDFAELVRGREEFDEWVKRGVSRRLEGNAAARYFLKRAAIEMPAYEKHLEEGDLDALWAYVKWLRRSSP